MFDNPLYNVPIESVLEALGARKGRARDIWFSPFREESEASLAADKVKNLWYDHGLGQGGSVVQLVMLTKRCSLKEAERFVAALSPGLAIQQTFANTPERKTEVRRVREISADYLKRYLASRKIPLELARQYCKEVTTFNPQKNMHFTLVGFPNNAGGYALSSPGGFKSTTKAGITTIDTIGSMSVNPSAKSVAVFEGFFDFLSWQVMQSGKTPTADVVVLNSVNNLQKASAYIDLHDKILCFLDNDEAGQRCTKSIEDRCRGKEVIDMSDLYGDYKDLNEMLQNSRGYTAKMNLTPKI